MAYKSVVPAGLLINQFAINDAVSCVTGPKVSDTTHYINWGQGVLAGEVTIETANDPAYTGSWSPVAVVNFLTTSSGVSAPKQDAVRIQGKYKAFRHRITQPLQGGTVSSTVSAA